MQGIKILHSSVNMWGFSTNSYDLIVLLDTENSLKLDRGSYLGLIEEIKACGAKHFMSTNTIHKCSFCLCTVTL